jgi:hypothetical protein
MPWTKPIYRERPFLTAEYAPDAGGLLSPPMPEICPSAESGAAGSCRIGSHALRERKCGPGFELTIFRCKNHKVSFTVYPTGWMPYGRRPLIGEVSTFEAVEQLSNGIRWPEHSTNSTPTGKTQRRWVTAWSILIGICPSLSLDDRHKAGNTLGVPTLLLKEKADQIRAGPTIASRAQSSTYSGFTSVVTSLKTLLPRGTQVGYWGKHYLSSALIG